MMNKLFSEKVYRIIRQIPSGKVSTYGLVARKLNSKAYRAVGTACRKNPNAPEVPCHRVVNSNGLVGNYSGDRGIKGKIVLLEKEGVKVRNNRILDFNKVLHRF